MQPILVGCSWAWGWNSVPDPRSAACPCIPRETSLGALSLLVSRNTGRKQHTPDRGLTRVAHGFLIQSRFSAGYLAASYSCCSASFYGSIKFSEMFSSVAQSCPTLCDPRACRALLPSITRACRGLPPLHAPGPAGVVCHPQYPGGLGLAMVWGRLVAEPGLGLPTAP